MTRQSHEPELIGFNELYHFLNIDKRKLSVYIKRGTLKLPEPYQILAATPLWRKSDIEAWAANRDA